jgi:hypothetical protein
MPYPWPITDPVLQEALDIALDYLEFTGQATPFIPTQWLCANAILTGYGAMGSADASPWQILLSK